MADDDINGVSQQNQSKDDRQDILEENQVSKESLDSSPDVDQVRISAPNGVESKEEKPINDKKMQSQRKQSGSKRDLTEIEMQEEKTKSKKDNSSRENSVFKKKHAGASTDNFKKNLFNMFAGAESSVAHDFAQKLAEHRSGRDMDWFTKRYAAAIHFFLNDCLINPTSLQEIYLDLDFSYEEPEKVWDVFERLFTPETENADINAFVGAFGNVSGNELSDSKKTKLKAMRQISRMSMRSRLGFGNVSKAKISRLLSSINERQLSNTLQKSANMEKKRIEAESRDPLKFKSFSLVEMFRNMTMRICSKDVAARYLEFFFELQFVESDKAMDLNHLNFLREQNITVEFLNQIMYNLHFAEVEDLCCEYHDYTTKIVDGYNDIRGNGDVGMLKSHIVYWRQASLRPFVELPFFHLIDNIAFCLIYFDILPKINQRNAHFDDEKGNTARVINYNSKMLSLSIAGNDSVDATNDEFMFRTFSEALKNCRTEHFQPALVKHRAKERMKQIERNKSVLADSRKVRILRRNEFFQRLSFALLLVAAVITGSSLMYSRWKDAATTVSETASKNLNAEVNQATFQATEEFVRNPYIVQKLNHQYFSNSNVSDSNLEGTLEYFGRTVHNFGLRFLYFGTTKGFLVGAATLSNNQIVQLMVNVSQGPCYARNVSFAGTTRDIQVSDFYIWLPSYNVLEREWYQVGSQLTFSSTNSFAWTKIYDFNSTQNDFGISLVSPFSSASEGVQGVFGVDLTFSKLSASLDERLNDDWDGAVVGFDSSDRILYSFSSISSSREFKSLKGMNDEYSKKINSFVWSMNPGPFNLSDSALQNLTASRSIKIRRYTSSDGLDIVLASFVDSSEKTLSFLSGMTILVMLITVICSCYLSYLSFTLLHPEAKTVFKLAHAAEVTDLPVKDAKIDENEDIFIEHEFEESKGSISESGGDSVGRLTSENRTIALNVQPAPKADHADREKEEDVSQWRVLFNELQEYFFSIFFSLFIIIKKSCRYVVRRFNNFFLKFGVPIVIIGIILQYFVWIGGSSSKVEGQVTSFLNQTVERATSFVEDITSRPSYILQTNQAFYSLGVLSDDTSNMSIILRDSFFYEMMQTFLNPDGSYIVDGMYVAFEADGLFAGAQQYKMDGRTFLVTMSRDPSTSFCYRKFLYNSNLSSPLYGTRDPSIVTFSSAGCLYDPRTRPWYSNAKISRKVSWTSVYTFTDGSLGITLSFPLIKNNSIYGVLAADLKLEEVSRIFSMLEILTTAGVEDMMRFFVINQEGTLIASSAGELFLNKSGVLSPVSAVSSSDRIISSTASVALQEKKPKMSLLKSITEIRRSLLDPSTYESPVFVDHLDSHWVLLFTVSKNTYLGPTTSATTVELLLTLTTSFIVVYITSTGLRTYSAKKSSRKEKRYKIEKEKFKFAFDKTSFQYWRNQLDLIVKQEFMSSWVSKDQKAISPVISDYFLLAVARKAKQFIRESSQGRDVAYSILLRSLNEFPIVYTLYKINRHFLFRLLLLVATLFHVPLSFFKPANAETLKIEGLSTAILAVEGLIITSEVFHGIVSSMVLYKLIKAHKKILGDARDMYGVMDESQDASMRLAKLLRSKFRGYLARYVFLLIALSVITTDWFLLVYLNFSLEYYFPIRVIVVILINTPIRRVVVSFFSTATKARREFTLYFSSLVFAAIVGMILLGATINTDTIVSNFSNFTRSITTSFIFFATGTNYSSAVLPAFEYNKLFILYFNFMTIMGTFIVGAFVISTFFESFEKEFRIELLKKKQRSRSGYFAGYAIMDFGHQGEIPPKLLSVFYRTVTEDTDEPERLKEKREKDFVKKSSNLEGFVEGLELHFDEITAVQYMERLGHFDKEFLKKKLELKYEKEMSSHQSSSVTLNQNGKRFTLRSPLNLTNLLSASTSSGNLRRRIFVMLARPWFSNLITFLVLLQCGLCAFYGYVEDYSLDIANIFICMVFFVEISLKVYSYGWHAFFNSSRYNFEGFAHLCTPEYEMVNRVDFFAVITASVSIVSAMIRSESFLSAFSDNNLRFGLAFLVVRIFTQLGSNRKLIYPIFTGVFLKQFGNLFILLLLVMYTYSIYGTQFFANILDPAVLGDSTPAGNFDSLTGSMICLFNMIVNFDLDIFCKLIVPGRIHFFILTMVSLDGVVGLTDFVSAWFFLSFLILVNMLFTNVFVSLVLAILEKVRDKEGLSRLDLEKLMIGKIKNSDVKKKEEPF